MSRSHLMLGLAACVVLGAALRANDLEGALVWHDEVFTQVFAAGHGAGDWLPLFDGEVRPITDLREARVQDPDRSAWDTAIGLARDEPQHPPLYYVAARAFGSVVTAPDVTNAAKKLRWLTWFFSLLGILAMGWCAQEVFGGAVLASRSRLSESAVGGRGSESVVGDRGSDADSAVGDRTSDADSAVGDRTSDADSAVGDRTSESDADSAVGDRTSESTVEARLSDSGPDSAFGGGLSESDSCPRVLAAVALFAVSPFHVFYAQEAREYALWTAFGLAATAALLRARRVRTKGAWLLYALLLVLGFYTSFAMLTVAVGHALFVAGRDLPRRTEAAARRSLTHAVGAWLLGALLFLPWALLLLEHWDAFQASMAWSSEIAVPRSELVETFALNLTRAFTELGADGVTPGVALIGALLSTAVIAGLRGLRSEALVCLLALFVAPLLFYLLPDLIGGGIRSLSARYLIPSLLALQLAVAGMVPATDLPRAERNVRWLTLTTLLAIGALTSFRAAEAEVPWTKGISRPLPAIARALEPHPNALIVVDHERHHPGTILTLSGMLADTTAVQLLPTVEDYALVEHSGPIFLLDASPRFRSELEASAGVTITPVSQHLHASLYRVVRP